MSIDIICLILFKLCKQSQTASNQINKINWILISSHIYELTNRATDREKMENESKPLGMSEVIAVVVVVVAADAGVAVVVVVLVSLSWRLESCFATGEEILRALSLILLPWSLEGFGLLMAWKNELINNELILWRQTSLNKLQIN